MHAAKLLGRTAAGIPIRVTECRAWKPALCGTHRVYWPPKWRDHVSTYLLSFAQRLGIAFTLEEARPYLYVDPLDRARIQKRIVGSLGDRGPLFATQPGSRGTSLNWPIENYFQLIERLSTVGRVLVTGSVFDRERLDWILGRLTPALRERVMLMTDLTLSELVAALSRWSTLSSARRPGPCTSRRSSRAVALGLYSDLFDQHPRRWRPIGQSGSYLLAHWNFPKVDLSPELAQRHMSQITVEMVADRMLQSASVAGEAARIA